MQTLAVAHAPATAADFADVYAAHHAEALRLAFLLTGDRHRAEDAVADAFVNVYRQLRRTEIAQPRAYVRRAVVNEVNSRFRRLALERRHAAARSGDERGQLQPADAMADHDEMFVALRGLPQRQRTVVVLRYYEDLAEKDIAAAMGVSVGTVKSTLHRALANLRSRLGEGVS